MNLVFIYGPPAAGKLTVANALQELIGYPVFHNHMAIGIVAPLFPHSDPKLNPIRSRLGKEIRLRIFEEAATAGVSFTTTFGAAGPTYFEFFRKVVQHVEAAGGRVLFVQLLAEESALMTRVGEDSRKAHGKIDSANFLAQRLGKEPETLSKFPDVDHPTIDNTHLTPEQVAEQIRDHYQL